MRRALLVAAFTLGCAGAGFAQTAQPEAPAVTVDASTPAAPEANAPSTSLHVPAGTEVVLELVDTLNSRTSHPEDHFAIRLREPVYDGAEIAIPAGTVGVGEVIDAGPGGMSGRQGKLVIAARYLDLNGQHIRVRGMTMNGSGESRVDGANAIGFVPYLGLIQPFIMGGEITMPPGTVGHAHIVTDVEIPRAAAPTPTAQQIQPAPAEAQTTGGSPQ